MIDHAKNISLYLIMGLLVNIVIGLLKSDFLSAFLSQNLITLLIALLAINTTTLSVVLTKVRELEDKIGGNFERTANEMKVSITEQVILIVVAIIVQIMKGSELLQARFEFIDFVADVILIGVLSYALYILYDTANSVFVILQFDKEKK